jgi:argininosuccinate lyase
MQEDKEALFDTVDTIEGCMTVMTLLLNEVSFKGDTMKMATERGYLMATDLADYLVTKGMTFRKAHEIVGKIILFAIDQKKSLKELTLENYREFSRQITKDVYDWLEPESAISRRNLIGGTGSEMVKKSIEKAKEEIDS